MTLNKGRAQRTAVGTPLWEVVVFSSVKAQVLLKRSSHSFLTLTSDVHSRNPRGIGFSQPSSSPHYFPGVPPH